MEAKRAVAVFITIIVVASVVIGAVVTLETRAKKAGPVGPSTVTVEIRNFAFLPQNITITLNATVRWNNNDSVAHTVTTLSGAPVASDSGAVAPGGSYTHTFTVVGTYPYYCSIHPFMRGNLTVVSAAPAVDIKNFAFLPGDITVPAGTAVIWTNNDSSAHTVTSLSGAPVAFDSGVLNPGATFSYTFTQPGIYPYHCRIHPWMLGNVTVTP